MYYRLRSNTKMNPTYDNKYFSIYESFLPEEEAQELFNELLTYDYKQHIISIYGKQILYFKDPVFSKRSKVEPPEKSDIINEPEIDSEPESDSKEESSDADT